MNGEPSSAAAVVQDDVVYTLDGVWKSYGRRRRTDVIHALRHVTMSILPGESVAVIGHSGAGKSTLFQLLNGTQRTTRGSVRFRGADLETLSPAALRSVQRRIGTVHQQHHLVPTLPVLHNTLCGGLGRWSLWRSLRNRVTPAKEDVDTAIHALSLVGLVDRRDERTDRLSGGQQQRVAIARVLMQDPHVVLADEPIASLDPALADAAVRLLVELADAGRMRTLVVALHDVDLARSYFSRIVGLRDGAVVFDMRSSDLSRTILRDFYASAS
jgi:phosphonate transport system ATP-binding protein